MARAANCVASPRSLFVTVASSAGSVGGSQARSSLTYRGGDRLERRVLEQSIRAAPARSALTPREPPPAPASAGPSDGGPTAGRRGCPARWCRSESVATAAARYRALRSLRIVMHRGGCL